MSFVDQSRQKISRVRERTADLVPGVAQTLARWGMLSPRDPVERLGIEFDRIVGTANDAAPTDQPRRTFPPRLKLAKPAFLRKANGDAEAAGLPPFSASIADADDAPLPIPDEPIEDDALVVRGLRKAYRGRVVVRDAGLTVKRGEAVGLLGPNGAGKTTIFYMITGLVLPDAGQIHLDGHEVTRLPMYQRARLGIGYLPQEASIFRGMTVEQNILAVLEMVEADADKRQNDLDALLDEFDITRLRNTPSIALSGGERRRCEIARALASRPAFMLLDEPFAGVDPIAVSDIRTLVRHLTTRGIGVLITDHNVRETLGLIDRATIIHSGTVLTEGTPEAIIADEEARRLYLGESFTL
jgi:lipopolysaccharide export system ATP-binding protein